MTTASGARIATLLTYTGQSILALVVVRTLGSATWRRALELRQAIAARLTVLVRTLSIWSAWRWVAWITSLFWLAFYNNRIAQSVGISTVTSDAFTVSTMLHRLTNCVQAALSWAGIHALVVDARVLLGAVRTGVALQPTIGRLTQISSNAGADRVSISLNALRIGSTWRWLTRIDNWLIPHRCAVNKRIASHALGTATHGNVIDGIAKSVLGTCSWARINALIAYTCTISGALGVQHALGTTTDVGIALIVGQA